MRRVIIPLFMLLLNQPSALGQWVRSDVNMEDYGRVVAFSSDIAFVVASTPTGLIYRLRPDGPWSELLGTGIDPSEQVICFGSNGNVYYAGTLSRIYRGSSAISYSDFIETGAPIRGFANHGDTMFAVTDGNGVLRSIDQGMSWHSSDSLIFTDSLSSIVSNGDLLFVGTKYNEIYMSINHGMSWEYHGFDPWIQNWAPFCSLLIYGSSILAGTCKNPPYSEFGQGLWRGINEGYDWYFGSYGIPNYSEVPTLINVDGVLFAANNGVKISTDTGVTWTLFMSGIMPGCFFQVTNFHATTEDIYVGLSSDCKGKIYQMNRHDFLSSLRDMDIRISFRIHPNPASDLVSVQVKNSLCTGYKLLDALGREVKAEKFLTRSMRFDVEVSHLPSGIYTVMLDTQAGPAVARLVKE